MLRFMLEHSNHARFKSHDGNENGNGLCSYHFCLDSLKRGYDIPLLAIPPNESSCGEHLIFGQSLVAWQPPSQKGILSSFFTRTGDRLSRRSKFVVKIMFSVMYISVGFLGSFPAMLISCFFFLISRLV